MKFLINMNKRLRIGILYSGFILSFFTLPLLGNFWFISILIMFTFLGLLIYTNGEYARRNLIKFEEALPSSLAKNNFKADDSFLSDDFLTAIAFNASQNKIALLSRNKINEDFTFRKVDFSKIMECSIKEDGQTVTKTSKGLAVGGTLVAGAVGGILGGVIANKNSSEHIMKATLNIVIDDLSIPSYDINFLNSKVLLEKSSEEYLKIYQDLNKWNNRLCVIINRNELNKQSV